MSRIPDWLLPPNLLTYARLAMTPWIGWCLGHNQAGAALPWIVAAAFTDAFDGWLARCFQWTSPLGAKLDPIADKVMLATVYLGLGLGGRVPLWLVWLVLGRDVLILLFAVFALLLTKIHEFPPSPWGKLSTFCQMGFAAAVVLDAVAPAVLPGGALFAGLWLTAAATVWSGVHYGWLAARMLR
jgi:cardiolipin synthase